MSVLVYVEADHGGFKKNAFESVYYGAQIAKTTGGDVTALVCHDVNNAAVLGEYGATKVIHQKVDNPSDSQVIADVIKQAVDAAGAKHVVLSNTAFGKSLAGRVAVKLNAGLVSGTTTLPEINGDSVTTSKQVFSGKAIAKIAIKGDKKVYSVMGNSLKPEVIGSPVAAEEGSFDVKTSRVKVIERKTVDGTVPLPEAELVVSAGRGMKGPENWGIVDELADVLGATTACSRPVADTGWRPHHEHVGQTGIAIRPNLYIAIGISGAIQHLAGVNNSKTIVVINKDPEAPFFKAADYGIEADLFEVVPKLTEALKKFKAS